MGEVEELDVRFNRPQMIVALVNAFIIWCLWGRGTGKTTGPLAWFMADRAEKMPGHTGGIFGTSFNDLEKKVLPKLLQGLADQGYQEGHHFVWDKRPPSDFDSPLTPVVSYKQHFSWYTGSVFPLVSLYQKGSANAYDFQSGIFDEVKLMSQKQLEDEIFPTFRGSKRHKKKFGHLSQYLSKIFATDKLQDPLLISWILKKRDLVDQQKVELVMSLQMSLNDLTVQLHSATEKQRPSLEQQINEIEYYLNRLRKKLVFVSEASAIDNLDVLGQEWLDDKIINMSEYELNVAIYNEDPEQASEGFYPDYKKEIHEYEADNDYNPYAPFIISSDYQHSIAPIPIAQICTLPGAEKPTLNFIDEVYTMAPEGLEEAVTKFCLKYDGHGKKVVYYCTDHNAIGDRQSAEPFNVIVTNAFIACGWHVVEVFVGQATEHFLRYLRMKFFFGNAKGTSMPIKINRKCIKMRTSINNAKTKIGNDGKTKKDKKYENTTRYPEMDQSETTHFSDAFDTVIEAVLEQKLININTSISTGGGVGFR